MSRTDEEIARLHEQSAEMERGEMKLLATIKPARPDNMPAITKLACYAILVACMLATILLAFGDLTGAIAVMIASVILLAGIIALNL